MLDIIILYILIEMCKQEKEEREGGETQRSEGSAEVDFYCNLAHHLHEYLLPSL